MLSRRVESPRSDLGQSLYASELHVSRGLGDWIDYCDRTAGQYIDIDLLLKQSQAVLCLGVGRGNLLFDILARYPNVSNLQALSREDLIYPDFDSFKQGVHRLVPTSEWQDLQQLPLNDLYNDILTANRIGDIEKPYPYTDGTFNLIFLGISVIQYAKNKINIIERTKKLLKIGGTALIDVSGLVIVKQDGSVLSQSEQQNFFSSTGSQWQYFPEPAISEGLLVVHQKDKNKNNLNLKLQKSIRKTVAGYEAELVEETYEIVNERNRLFGMFG